MNTLEFIQNLLTERGYSTPELQHRFLNPDFDSHTYNPFFLPDMMHGIVRVFRAIVNNEKICVYSDYDADGIPGAVVMHDFFKKIGYANVCFYIPHRHSEGYGLHRDALEKIAADGATLMITVDLGITAVGEVEYARELGIEIIITDHHEPLETIPASYALINPKIPVIIDGEKILYPDPMLCGCAVAFKFVQGILATLRVLNAGQSDTPLSDEYQEILANFHREFTNSDSPDTFSAELLSKIIIPATGWEKWLLDMVGIATLSDMVPLVNENRVLAKFGFQVIQKTRRPGLLALLQLMRMNPNQMTEDDVVFSITPRLNAASRMAHPEIAFKLLTTSDMREGMEIAKQLTKLNDERKLEVARAMRSVHKKMEGRTDLPSVIVIGDPEWTPGVLGLIASKIVEEYERTTFVWCIENDMIKGSCRAKNGDHVVDLMNGISDQFIQYGGHEGAGGFSMNKENIHFLEDKLNEVYANIPIDNTEEKIIVLNSDSVMIMSDISRDMHTALRSMAPFGLGNKKPLFLWERVTPESTKQFGKGNEHLEIVFRNGSSTIRAIQFFASPKKFGYTAEELLQPINLYGEIEYSVFMGKGELRMKIVNIEKIT